MYWYVTEIQDIPIPFLHDTAKVLSLRKDDNGNQIFKFRSLHMDPRGECAIAYYGWLTQQQIKEVMINFCYPSKSYDDIHPTVWKDYEYIKGNSTEKNPDYTVIYTPDGLDYRTLNSISTTTIESQIHNYGKRQNLLW